MGLACCRASTRAPGREGMLPGLVGGASLAGGWAVGRAWPLDSFVVMAVADEAIVAKVNDCKDR